MSIQDQHGCLDRRQRRFEIVNDEGEVLLRVLFSATGEVRVLDVVKSLPHGLDQSARQAAEKIRFKPATKDGTAVDSVAIVHITFQLAY